MISSQENQVLSKVLTIPMDEKRVDSFSSLAFDMDAEAICRLTAQTRTILQTARDDRRPKLNREGRPGCWIPLRLNRCS